MSESRLGSRRRRPSFQPLRSAVRIVALAVLLFVALPYLIAPLYRLVDPVSTLMLSRWLTGQHVERSVVPLERMGARLPVMAIVAEDGRFCSHWGADFQQISAVLDDAELGSELRGASTITQQTVKNLFLWHGRSYVRKALELPLALWFDLVLPKRRIMEIYLNIVEWGPNGVFGAQAAARRAFAKSAATLTAREAALLVASLPNPIIRNPRQPGSGLNRLASLYQSRARQAGGIDCIRAGR